VIDNLFARLPRFVAGRDLDTPTAIRLVARTRVGPVAYLHVIYKPAEEEIVREVFGKIRAPPSLRRLYALCNGASLFSGAIRIFGCVAAGTLLDRRNPLSLPPLDIVKSNRQFVDPERFQRQVCIGAYGFDRSLVCVDRKIEMVTCYEGEEFKRTRKKWPTVDSWITGEIDRLSMLFSDEGERLVSENFCLPGSDEARLS
jgi:hypothetical protein